MWWRPLFPPQPLSLCVILYRRQLVRPFQIEIHSVSRFLPTRSVFDGLLRAGLVQRPSTTVRQENWRGRSFNVSQGVMSSKPHLC
ncbi:hypothetical protein QBC45DRAFT_421031 [Copromyces sp. CBS 386.78]|nr:hypothetical protein QBC45DRAFT_421031 [Copromyces sp. CBS 386.78]